MHPIAGLRTSALVAMLALTLAACRPGVDTVLATADAHFAAGRLPEAITEYNRVLGRDPNHGEARFRMGRAYERAGRLRQAAAAYTAAAELIPDNVEAQIAAANTFLLQHRFEDTRIAAERALQVKPAEVRALILRARAQAGLNRTAAALADLEQAIALDPTFSGTYFDRGLLQVAAGDPAKGEASLLRAIEADPASAYPHVILASLHWAQGALDKAEAQLLQAVAVQPGDFAAHRALAALYLGANRVAEAEQHLKSIADRQATAGARLSLADFYLVVGNQPQATSVLQALAADPKAPGYADARSRLAALAYAAGRKEEAHRVVDGTIEQDPRSPRALVTKAQFLVTERKIDQALVFARRAVTADPRAVTPRFLLASVLSAQQDVNAAVN